MVLINADCFSHNLEADIIFTSPPYNRKRNDKYTYYDDNIDDYFSFLCRFIDKCKYRNLFLNIMANYYNKKDVYKLFGKYYDKICQVFIWEKTNPLPAQGYNITNSYEYIIVFGDSLKSNYTYTKNILSTSINNRTNKIHKAVMNQEVSDWFIERFTKEDDIVLDPFMGLGTTGLSCKKK